MKFDCGLTWREKYERLISWHPWFAWYPVRIGQTHDCVWWEYVERKGESGYNGMAFEYRLPSSASESTK